MNRRFLLAHVRLAMARGGTPLAIGAAFAGIGVVGAALAPGGAAWVAVVAAALVLAPTTLVAPLAALTTEKMLGTLEADRTLPVALHVIAAGRLLGSAARTAPVAAILVAVGIATAKTWADLRLGSLVIALPIALLAYWSALWLFYAVSARFSMRWIVWIPAIAWLFGMTMSPAMEAAITRWILAATSELFRESDPSAITLLGIVLVALTLAALAFAASSAVLASALARFQHDPSVMTGVLGKVPRRELAAIGRGVLLAVARLRLRLATEQFRREMILVGILVAIILLDVRGIADFARSYLPILATLVPAMIALQLMQGRSVGTLESLQQLPHSRRLIALGHLLAVMVLAVAAVAIFAVSRVADGTVVTASGLVIRWLMFATIGYSVAAVTVWATAPRLLALGGITVAIVIGIVWFASSESRDAGLGDGSTIGVVWESNPVLPAVICLVAIAIATELFAWGLATYQASTVKR